MTACYANKATPPTSARKRQMSRRTGPQKIPSSAPTRQHHATGPRQLGKPKILPLLQRGDQMGDFFGVAFGPVRLGQHVVDDVQAAGVQQRQHLVEQAIFARPGVGKNEVKTLPLQRAQEIIAIGAGHRQARVGAEVLFQDGQQRLVVVHRAQAGRRIHAVEQPGGGQARTRTQLQKPRRWLGRGQRAQQRAGQRLGRHREAAGPRVGPDTGNGGGFVQIGQIIHEG